MIAPANDLRDIDALTAAFFDLFTLDDHGTVDLSAVHTLFVPDAQIVKACTGTFEVYDLARFIAPREKLLNSGEFTSFHEEEISGDTNIFQNIAQRFCKYRKWGERAGQSF